MTWRDHFNLPYHLCVCFVVFRGVECDRSLGKLSHTYLHGCYVNCQILAISKVMSGKVYHLPFISTISIYFFMNYCILYIYMKLYEYTYNYPMSYIVTGYTAMILWYTTHVLNQMLFRHSSPEARDGLKRVKDVCEVGNPREGWVPWCGGGSHGLSGLRKLRKINVWIVGFLLAGHQSTFSGRWGI